MWYSIVLEILPFFLPFRGSLLAGGKLSFEDNSGLITEFIMAVFERTIASDE